MRKTANRHFLVPHFILVVEQKHLYMSYSHHVFDSWEANKTQSQPIWNAISDPIIKIHLDPFPMGNLNSWTSILLSSASALAEVLFRWRMHRCVDLPVFVGCLSRWAFAHELAAMPSRGGCG